MNVKILLEGKIKEPYFKLGIDEFKKRLFNSVEVIETTDIAGYIEGREQAYVIAMEIEGKMLSSTEFAAKLREIEQDGYYNEIIFLIGGSDGLTPEVSARAHFKFSMSKLTFLHQEAVLILIEQIYRAHKILSGEPYHK